MIHVNVEALVDLDGRWLPGMVDRGAGAVINVASTASFQPIPVQAVYAATKAFVRASARPCPPRCGDGRDRDRAVSRPGRDGVRRGRRIQERANPGPSFVYSTAEDVARAGIEGADKGKRVVIPGLGNRFQATLGQHGPRALMLGPVRPACTAA